MEVSQDERVKTVEFWRRHEESLRSQQLVSDNGLHWLNMCTQPDCIGYDQGQVRPGNIGRWDLYYTLQMSLYFGEAEMLLLADIKSSEMANCKREEDMRNSGFDPSDPEDVDRYGRLQTMTPEGFAFHELMLLTEKHKGL